jgi:spore coat protein U-like protein
MKRISLAAALLGVLAAGRADAATTSSNLTVTATVNRVCTIGSATLAFPAYSPESGVGLTSQPLAVRCNKGFAPSIALGQGQSFSGTRRMSNGTDQLGYTLQLRSGSSTGETVTTSAAGASGDIAVSVEGTIPASQWVSEGSYQDVVTMTVTF